MAERETTKMNSSFRTKIFDGNFDLINIDFTNGPSDALREMVRNNPGQLQSLTSPEVSAILVSLVNLHDEGCERCANGQGAEEKGEIKL